MPNAGPESRLVNRGSVEEPNRRHSASFHGPHTEFVWAPGTGCPLCVVGNSPTSSGAAHGPRSMMEKTDAADNDEPERHIRPGQASGDTTRPAAIPRGRPWRWCVDRRGGRTRCCRNRYGQPVLGHRGGRTERRADANNPTHPTHPTAPELRRDHRTGRADALRQRPHDARCSPRARRHQRHVGGHRPQPRLVRRPEHLGPHAPGP